MDITNQLCSVQNALVGLDSKVDVLSEKTQTLAKRLATLEEATEQHPPKKKRVQIPPELSVSTCSFMLYPIINCLLTS